MDFVLSDHARKRCSQRGLHPSWVAAALECPARTESDHDDPSLTHALLPIAERGFRVLRVIYKDTRLPWLVVTAFFDDSVTDL